MAFIQGSYARSNEMFQSAHHLQVSQCSFTNVGGNVYYDSPAIPYVKGPLFSAGPDYYIVGLVKQGNPWESVHIVRRFTSEKDRDQFSSLLHKLGWAPFTMKPLWSLMIHGDPCLAVASAAVYTWKDMGKDSWAQRLNLYLKLSKFFLSSSDVYPGSWVWRKLWNGRGKYKNLKLFDIEGNLVIDPEQLQYCGLLYQKASQFGRYADMNFCLEARRNQELIIKYYGKEDTDKLMQSHIKTSELDDIFHIDHARHRAIDCFFNHMCDCCCRMCHCIRRHLISFHFDIIWDSDDEDSDDDETHFEEIS